MLTVTYRDYTQNLENCDPYAIWVTYIHIRTPFTDF